MPDTLLLHWTFEPIDVFEESTELTCENQIFVIDRGAVTVQVPTTTSGAYEELGNQYHQMLDAAFLGAQLCNHRPYNLSRPGIVRITEDGIRHQISIPQAGGLTFGGSAVVDILERAPDGSVLVDTKRDRITARNALALRVAEQFADSIVSALVRSYAAAVNDPGNELVHLYEIREALSKRFGGDREARDALGIPAGNWSTLGKLSNYEPLRQGRHRGQHPTQLREATEQELTDARKLARDMVERYLSFLTPKQ